MRRLDSVMREQVSHAVATLAFRERMRQRLRTPLYRNALYLIMASALTGVAGLVFWLLAARFYDAEDVGLASAAISAMQLLALFATLGLDYALIRFLPSAEKDSNALLNSCLTIGVLTSIIMALIFIAGLGVWSPALLFLRQDPVFLSAFVIFTASGTLYMLLNRAFVARRTAGFTLGQASIFNLLRLSLIMLLGSFFATFGIFASWGIGSAAAVIIGMLLFLPAVQAGYRPLPVIKRDLIGNMMRFSLANYVTALLWLAPTFILPVMVVNLVGAEPGAYFYIAWSICTVLSAIPVSISLSLFAEGSYNDEGLGRNIRRSLKFTGLIVIPAVLLIVLIGDRLLLVFGPSYADNATNLLRLLALSVVPLSLNHIYFGVKRVQMKMKGVVGMTALTAIATLALSWFLLPRMGISGAGVAWLSSQAAVASAVVLIWLPRARKRRPDSTATR